MTEERLESINNCSVMTEESLQSIKGKTKKSVQWGSVWVLLCVGDDRMDVNTYFIIVSILCETSRKKGKCCRKIVFRKKKET